MEALIILFVTGLISMFIAMARKPLWVLVTALSGLVLSEAIFVFQWLHPNVFSFNISYEGLKFDQFALMMSMTAILFAILIIVAGYQRFKNEIEHTGEYISLLLFSLCGAVCLTAFTDLFMFFLGLEIMSIPVYVMAGSKKQNLLSTEASLKYFFIGAFATGLLLFGIAWMYGAVGTFSLAEIQLQVMNPENQNSLLFVGVLLILASFLFKVGAAPFHFWSPDVYGGSPNIVTGFMAAVVKLAAFAAFIRLFSTAFGPIHEFWADAIMILAILTMFVGNLSALRQTKLKRLIAYSSITHVGYALMTVMTGNAFGLWVYLFAYGFSIIGLIVVSMILDDETDEISSYTGFARKYPFAGFVLILSMLSLAGVPPLAGFFGKYLVFSSTIGQYPVLVFIALANSGIAIYYYLKLIKISLEKSEEETAASPVNPAYMIVLGVCALGMLLGGAVSWLF